MKLLVIGIDGATEEIFDLFEMPCWQAIKCRGKVLPVREDLLHRGWAKMISGQMATENGSFYFRPLLDGSRSFTDSYNVHNLQSVPNFRPIWAIAQGVGGRVGIMNIPTASPAQVVPGFFIAGGGGGVYTSGMPEGCCYPPRIERILRENNYIFDTRLGQSTFNSPADLFRRLSQMMENRTKSFIALAKNQIDFGFLAYRALSVVLYLAMSEIAEIMTIRSKPGQAGAKPAGWYGLIQDHLTQLDQSIDALLNELAPENFMVVSDHSMVPYRYDANLNFSFVDAGLAEFHMSPLRLARNIARLFLRPNFRRIMGSIDGTRDKLLALALSGSTVKSSSKIFGSHYVSGAYVNDRRFKGPVTDEQIDLVVDRAVEWINASSEATQAGWRAVPYRRRFLDHLCSDAAPDLKIEHNGSTFFNVNAGVSLRKNENYGPVVDIEGVSGMHTGQKGDRPLILMNDALASKVNQEDPQDLRIVHRLTERLFSGT